MSILPNGSWPSPLSVDDVSGSSRRFGRVVIDGDSTYFKETGASGLGSIMCVNGSTVRPIVECLDDGTPVDVGTRVHEYGGLDFDVHSGVLVFSHKGDNRLYASVKSDGVWSAPRPVTPHDSTRYADLTLVGTSVYAVAERHGEAVENMVVVVDIEYGTVTVLAQGADFYANPRPNPSETALAWYEWNHPSMPWDSTQLMVAELLGPELSGTRQVAGGPGISVVSPVWVADDELLFVSDETGWWNPYRANDPLHGGRIRALHPAEAEFAAPPWNFDTSLVYLDDEFVVAKWTAHGQWHLGSLRIANGETEEWITGYEPIGALSAGEGRVAFVGASTSSALVVAELILSEGKIHVLRTSAENRLEDADISIAEPMEWQSGDASAYGFFYAPANSHVSSDDVRPPLLVLVHGGPTAATTATFSSFIQFWTTRGFAVLDVNYRGSTGFGRKYKDALNGQWGVSDIEDVAAGVSALAERGLIDPTKVVIRGGSAGGYTVLRALTSTDVFAGGTSRYGIADMALLAGDTHKFESRYTEGLVGPYPQAADIYAERSPINHLDSLTAPLLLLQGELDAVVPPNQAIQLADAVRERGGDVELVLYPDEGHGFVKAETARDALSRELAFYGRVLGFIPNPDRA